MTSTKKMVIKQWIRRDVGEGGYGLI